MDTLTKMKFNLKNIRNEKIREIEVLKERRSLRRKIEESRRMNLYPIIAEIKLRSPVIGRISNNDPVELAKIFEKAGVCGISVLTDKNFDGKIDYLRDVKRTVKLPVLRKDFIVDEFQIYESYAYGADVILLITEILKDKTKEFVRISKKLGMEAIVEVHKKENLEYALKSKTNLIGINSRDLDTLKIDLDIIEKLIPEIPDDRIIIGESGINNKDDLRRIFSAGVDAVLIGTGIVTAENIEEKIQEFVKKK